METVRHTKHLEIKDCNFCENDIGNDQNIKLKKSRHDFWSNLFFFSFYVQNRSIVHFE